MWWDEAGMCGCIFLQTRPRGTCCRIQRCTGMSRGDEVAGAAPSLCNDWCQGGVAEHASFFMRQSTVASGSISSISCSRGSHLEIWSIFSSRRRIWQFMFCVWVLLEEHRELNSSGDAVSLAQGWLKVKVKFCNFLKNVDGMCVVW